MCTFLLSLSSGESSNKILMLCPLDYFNSGSKAGICVRGEKQRAQIQESMTQSRKNTAWYFRGIDMVSVLAHLWRGVAANGRAVTWEDYVNSRRASIHIDL